MLMVLANNLFPLGILHFFQGTDVPLDQENLKLDQSDKRAFPSLSIVVTPAFEGKFVNYAKKLVLANNSLQNQNYL